MVWLVGWTADWSFDPLPIHIHTRAPPSSSHSHNTIHTNHHSLSQPLHPEAAALVRQLYRRCWTLRAALPSLPSPPQPQPTAAATAAALASEEGAGEEEGEERRRHLARLNTLIAITGTYFSQGEKETAAIAAASTSAVVASDGGGGDMRVEEGEEGGAGHEQEEEDEEEEEGEIREAE